MHFSIYVGIALWTILHVKFVFIKYFFGRQNMSNCSNCISLLRHVLFLLQWAMACLQLILFKVTLILSFHKNQCSVLYNQDKSVQYWTFPPVGKWSLNSKQQQFAPPGRKLQQNDATAERILVARHSKFQLWRLEQPWLPRLHTANSKKCHISPSSWWHWAKPGAWIHHQWWAVVTETL